MKKSSLLSTFSTLAVLAARCTALGTKNSAASAIKLAFEKSHGSSYEEASRERGDIVANIGNQQTFYSVQLEVGTPGQNITVLLDTGSSDLWVTANTNPYCEPNHKSKSKSRSKSSSKSTSKSSSKTVSASKSTTSQHKRDEFSSLLSLLSAMESALTAEPTGTWSGSGIPFWSGSGSTIPSRSEVPTASVTPQATMDCSLGTFNANKSRTFKSNGTSFEITYGDLSFASGIWGTDDISLGNVTLSSVSLAVANVTNSSVGVLGLGLPEDESTYSLDSSENSTRPYEYYNFPALLKRDGLIHKTAYSLYLNATDASYGNILFGAVDHAKYSGQLYTVPLLNPDSKEYPHPVEFDVTLQGVGLTNGSSKYTFTTTPIPALLDSGTTLMYLPYQLADEIAQTLGGEYSEDIGYYVIPCPSADDDSKLVYDFGGFNIATNLSNYMLGTVDGFSDDSQCALGILPSDVEAILGDVFLVDAYVIYNLDDYEVSLAQASYDNAKEDIEIITSTVPSATKAPRYSSTWSDQRYSTGGNIFTTSKAK